MPARCSPSALHALLTASLIAGLVGARSAEAQDEVARQLAAARAALEQDDPSSAERALLRALDLAPDDPEIHWRLGQARSLAGDVRGAIAAWRRTLELAPEHRRARALLDALEGETLETTQRLLLIEELIEGGYDEKAAAELERLRREQALEGANLERALELRTVLLARREKPDAASVLASLRELELRFPVPPEDAERALLVARALLAAGRRADALARFESLSRGSGAEALEAQLDLELARIDGTGSRAEAIEAWIAAHEAHARVREALRAALGERMARAERTPSPEPEADLPEVDAAVIAIGVRGVRADAPAGEMAAALQRLRNYFERRETRGPSEARCQAMERLLASSWPPVQRDALRIDLAKLRFARARAAVERLAERGALGVLEGSPDALPAVAAALRARRELRAELPALAADASALELAAALAQAAQSQTWPPDRRDLLAAERWALDLAGELSRESVPETAEAALLIAIQIAERWAARDRSGATAFVESLFASAPMSSSAAETLRARVIAWRLAAMDPATTPDRAEREARIAELLAFVARSIERRPALAPIFANELAEALGQRLAGARDADAETWLAAWTAAVRALPRPEARVLELRRIAARIDRAMGRDRVEAGAGLRDLANDAEMRAIVADVDALQAELLEGDPLHAECEAQRARWIAAVDAADERGTAAFELLAPAGESGSRPRVELHRLHLRFELTLVRARRALEVELARDVRRGEVPEALRLAIARHAELAGRESDAAKLAPRHEALLAIGADLAARNAASWALEIFSAVEKASAADDATSARARFATASTRQVEGLRERMAAKSESPELGPMLEAAIDDHAAILARWPRTPSAPACLIQVRALVLDLARGGSWGASRAALQRFLAAAPPLRAADELRIAVSLCEIGDLLGEPAIALLERALGTSALPEEEAKAAASAAPIDGFALDALVDRSALYSAARSNLVLAVPELKLFDARRNAAAALAERAARAKSEGLTQAGGERVMPELPAAEITRRTALFETVRAELQKGLDGELSAAAARLSRDVFDAMAEHWTRFALHESAALFLAQVTAADLAHPRRAELRLESALARLRWAAKLSPRAEDSASRRELEQRYAAAREALAALTGETGFPAALKDRAEAEAARSFIAQARTLAAVLGNRARGPYVRGARELARVARAHPQNPSFANAAAELLGLGDELTARALAEAAVEVWRVLIDHFPTDPAAREAAARIALAYASVLDRPLLAIEAYLELHHLGAGADPMPAAQILALAERLQQARRWVEALHALEVFVEGFPEHPQIATALERIGAVHAENGAWNEALAAYRRVIQEHEGTPVAHEARWATARAWIHLSRWTQAEEAYRVWLEQGGEEARTAEAERRRVVLKDLARHQALVDEEGQRKAFDAQFQIGRIVHEQLGEVGKAVLEYMKVAERWPESHLADDALYQVGLLRFQRGEIEEGRAALLQLAERYPSSPTSDDALFAVGESFEREADALNEITRTRSLEQANEVAQKRAYRIVADNRRDQLERSAVRLAEARKLSRDEADREAAFLALQNCNFDFANTRNAASWVTQQIEVLSAEQLADRQDRINAALRRAVGAFRKASQVASGDKADQALLRLAQIYDARLGDAEAALQTWSAIATQYAGTAVAEDASWRLAEAYQRRGRHQEAIEAFGSFLRNYRRSPRAEAAQVAIAEGLENLGRWIEAMDAYQRYLESFPEGGSAARAREQIGWIKTYRL